MARLDHRLEAVVLGTVVRLDHEALGAGRALWEGGGGCTPEQVHEALRAEGLRLTYHQVAMRLAHMADKGLVDRAAVGVYVAPGAGPDAVPRAARGRYAKKGGGR